MSKTPLIQIRNLHANAGETPILRGLELELQAGEVHAIMGPNGSGKSTLSNVLVGRPGYTVTDGEVLFRGKNLLAMDAETRAREGIFLAFQYPVEIPGGFSGGEKKRNEILQMLLLDPTFCILDETDSGLDIDALRTIANGVNQMRSPERAMLLITHYQRLLDYIVPDQVHVLSKGRIVRSGGKELALELEEKGYGWIEDESGQEAS